jgi:hypothetical protein
MKIAKEFIKFAVQELGIQQLPTDIKFVGNEYAVKHMTFGTYNPDQNVIVIVKANRHPVDVLRTLAHELVHHKQREDGQHLDGSDGSDTENEANARAGELMRKFRQTIPEIFNVGPWGFHTNMENKEETLHEIIRTKSPRKINGEVVDQFTAKLLLRVLYELAPANRDKFLSYPVEKMYAVAQQCLVDTRINETIQSY